MSLADASAHQTAVETELTTTIASLLGTDQLSHACSKAMRELGASYPVTNDDVEYWAVERGKRHFLDIIRTLVAYKFQYKKIYLNQRFEHYHAILQELDKRFKEAQESDPSLLGVDPVGLFGIYVKNNFIYDEFGHDITHWADALNLDTSIDGS